MKLDCDACQGIEPLTPETVANRPGLPALRYRAGTHGSFLESMIAQLSVLGAERAKEQTARNANVSPGQPPLPPSAWLRSRELSDPTIALLDAWSTVGDILTFYQERIANEGYLSTARERRSLHELANLVGYKLRPALSSSVYLAFDVQAPPALDLEVPPPPPHEVLIPKGTQARHIPGPGEQPQVFETKEDLVARPEWNQLKPRMTKPTVIKPETWHELDKLRFERIDHNLTPGDLLLLVANNEGTTSVTSRPLTLIREVNAVLLDAIRQQTVVDLVPSPFSYDAYVEVLKQAESLFVSAAESLSGRNQPFVVDIFTQLSPPTHGGNNSYESWKAALSAVTSTAYTKQTLTALDDKVWSKLLQPLLPDGADGKIPVWNSKPYAECVTSLNALTVIVRQATLSTLSTMNESLAIEIDKWAADILAMKTYHKAAADLITKLKNDQVSKPTAAQVKLAVGSADDPAEGTLYLLSQRIPGISFEGFHAKLLALDPPARPIEINTAVHAYTFALDVKAIGSSLEAMATILAMAKAALERNTSAVTSEDVATLLFDVDTAYSVINSTSSPKTTFGELLGAGIVVFHTSTLKVFDTEVSRIQHLTDGLYNDMDGADGTSKDVDQLDRTATKSEMDEIRTSGKPWPQVVRAALEWCDKVDRRETRIQVNGARMAQMQTAAVELVGKWKGASIPIIDQIFAEVDDMNSQMSSDQHRGMALQAAKVSLEAARKDDFLPAALVLSRIGKGADILSQLEKDAPLLKRRVESLKNVLVKEREPTQVSYDDPVSDFEDLDKYLSLLRGSASLGQAPSDLDPSRLLPKLRVALRPELQNFDLLAWGQMRRVAPTGQVYAFRSRVGLFGNKSPVYTSGLPDPKSPTVCVPTPRDAIDADDSGRTAEAIDVLFLERECQGVEAGGWCLVSGQPASQGGSSQSSVARTQARRIRDASVVQRSAYTLNGASVRIWCDESWRSTSLDVKDAIRRTTVFTGSIELPIADEVIEHAYPDTKERMHLELEEFYGDLAPGREITISGEQSLGASENATSDRVLKRAGGESRPTGLSVNRRCRVIKTLNSANESKSRVVTTLVVDRPLDIQFVRSSVRIYANVVEATNGSTVSEVIGNGEGQGAFQRFLLAQPRLAYLPAETPSGMKPELEVRVNEVAWNRAADVSELQPVTIPGKVVGGVPQRTGLPRRYLTSVDDDHRTFLTTGDGVTTGERLPTGITNVRATYRVGGGQDGNVKEGTITQLASPPLNVTKVRNLMRASGGVDRENVEQARKNLPVAVMSLDRLVSVADYESFSRKFAGIAKAKATPLSLGGRSTVVVTIAALDDQPIDRESLLYKNLDKALKKYADPEQAVLVEPRELMLLMTKAKIKIEDDSLFESVRDKVKQRILKRFDFEQAVLGQSVLLSDLIETIQNTPGVRYVDVDMFDRMRQFYGTADMVRKAACIATQSRPQAEISCEKARKSDTDRHTVILKPVPKTVNKTLRELLEGLSGFKKDSTAAVPSPNPPILDDHFVNASKVKTLDSDVVLNTIVDEDVKVTLRIFETKDDATRRPPSAGANSPAPFPAQLAYFTDLAGTILLEEIP